MSKFNIADEVRFTGFKWHEGDSPESTAARFPQHVVGDIGHVFAGRGEGAYSIYWEYSKCNESGCDTFHDDELEAS